MLRNDLIRGFLIAILAVAALHAASHPAQAAASPTQPLTVDSPMGALLDNAVARAIIEQHLPVLLSSAQIEQARGLSLRALQQFAPMVVTDDKLDAINAELAQRKVAGSIESIQAAEVAAAAREAAFREALTLVTIPLWEHGAPGAKGTQPSDIPSLTIVRPDGATSFSTAVIVAPGGGYQALAMGHEGRQVADLLAAQGITAFILRYRLCPYGYQHPTQLHDAQRAIRWVRAHAEEYGIDPRRIGMLGFSAGGHLTAMTSTLFDDGNPAASDPVDRMSSRPDFAVLGYAPVDLPKSAIRDCFVGPEPSEKVLREISPAGNVSAATPPTFIFHTTSDELVPSLNATRYYDALIAANVPAELHIFAEGRHGLGLAMTDPVLAIWPTLLANWLRASNLTGSALTGGQVLD